MTVQLYPGKVMNRIPAGLNQFENSLEPAFVARNAKCRPRNEPERSEPHDVGEIQIFKLLIVRNIEETGVRLNAQLWHCFAVSDVN